MSRDQEPSANSPSAPSPADTLEPPAPPPERSRTGKRTNGSRRRYKRARKRLQKWTHEGITIATLNIAGLTLAKLFLLLDKHAPDVLCL